MKRRRRCAPARAAALFTAVLAGCATRPWREPETRPAAKQAPAAARKVEPASLREEAAPGPRGTPGSGAERARTDAPTEPTATASPRAFGRYRRQRVSLDLRDADVHDVLRLLADAGGANIVAADDVHGRVTLRLSDVPWEEALEVLLRALDLDFAANGGVLRVVTTKRLRAEREERMRAAESLQAVEPLRIEYFRLNYAKARRLAEIVGGTKTAPAAPDEAGRDGDGGVLSSRGRVLVDEASNTLVVQDVPQAIDSARDLVRRLDVRTPQVLIESEIVEASSDFARQLGIQWGYRGGSSPRVTGSGLGSGPAAVPYIADFPAPGAVPGVGGALDLFWGAVDGEALDVRLSALEKQGRARIISRPRVVTLNNVAATIKSLTILRVKLPGSGTVVQTGSGKSSASGSLATEKIETGIILVVTPQVSSDGYVRLDLFAKSSQADFSRSVDEIPTEISREANAHVLVRDGQPVVLGGIYREQRGNRRAGVPYLSDVPVIGRFFRGDEAADRREDLLVILTPRVLDAPVAAPSPGTEPPADEEDQRGS